MCSPDQATRLATLEAKKDASKTLKEKVLLKAKEEAKATCHTLIILGLQSVPTKTQLSNFLGTPGEDYFKGNPKSLNFYFLVIWWGKQWIIIHQLY